MEGCSMAPCRSTWFSLDFKCLVHALLDRHMFKKILGTIYIWPISSIFCIHLQACKLECPRFHTPDSKIFLTKFTSNPSSNFKQIHSLVHFQDKS